MAALSSASAALREAWIAASSASTDAVLGAAFAVLVDASAASCEIIAAHALSGIASVRARQVAPTCVATKQAG